jgi:cation:H+ antiporter
MSNLHLNIIGFIVTTVIIVVTGYRLSKYGDMMADMLGWAKCF